MEYKPHYDNSHALIVGIDEYAHPSFRPLGNAEKDARAMADVLGASPFDFAITALYGENATRQAILDTLYEIQEQSSDDDRVLVYFAGHGYTITTRFGKEIGYLACADTIPQKNHTAIKMSDLTGTRDYNPAKHIAFILDACFGGDALGITRSVSAAAENFLTRRAFQVISAGAPGELVQDYQSMTTYLLDLLREPDVLLTISSVADHLRVVVSEATENRQMPVDGHITGSGGGEFVLFRTPDKPISSKSGEDRILDLLSLLPDDRQRYFFNVIQSMERDTRESSASDSVPADYDAKSLLAEVKNTSETNQIVLFNDPIFDILPEPFEWCKIPSNDHFDLMPTQGSKSIYQIESFMMAKYQITYEQFQVFLDAEDGFHNMEWWHGLAESAKHRSKPGKQSFTHRDNLPRDNVSWYDAMTFCRWLTSKVGYEVRLPTEWEWQWAAQGLDGRAYPWGNEYIKGYANVDESNIGGAHHFKTTPVGSYPQGRSFFGVLDMAGNVWEWCLNEYNDLERTTTWGDAVRASRGGSCLNLFEIVARSNYRSGKSPNQRESDIGFRISLHTPGLPGDARGHQ